MTTTSVREDFYGEILLFIAVLFFGSSIVALREAAILGIKPLVYNTCRFMISMMILVIFNFLRLVTKRVDVFMPQTKELLFWGPTVGLTNFMGSTLMQYGLETVSAQKTGFIVCMYVVLVPILAWAFALSDIDAKAWIAAIVCIFGLAMLSNCFEDNCFSNNAGTYLDFSSMIMWSANILCIAAATKVVDAVQLNILAMFTGMTLSFFVSLIFELHGWTTSIIDKTWLYILLAGIFEAAAFLLITYGQQYVTAVRASLILSLESIVSAIGGYIMLNETMYGEEIGGAVVIVLAQFIKFLPIDEIPYCAPLTVKLVDSSSSGGGAADTIAGAEEGDGASGSGEAESSLAVERDSTASNATAAAATVISKAAPTETTPLISDL